MSESDLVTLERYGGQYYLCSRVLVDMTTEEEENMGLQGQRWEDGSYRLNLDHVTIISLVGYYDGDDYECPVTQLQYLPYGGTEILVDKIAGQAEEVRNAIARYRQEIGESDHMHETTIG